MSATGAAATTSAQRVRTWPGTPGALRVCYAVTLVVVGVAWLLATRVDVQADHVTWTA